MKGEYQMIQAVLNSDLSKQSWNVNQKTKQTTITPFDKIMQKTTEVVPNKTAEVKESATITTNGSEKSNFQGKTSLKAIFEEASEKYNISYNLLVAVAKAESNFNPKSTSGKGAQGIMQLMPATAKELGVTDAYDVKQNIMAGAKYLSAHLKAFNGNTDLAVAAYNAGGGAVRKYGGVPPYSETKNYVKTVNKYMKEGVTVPDRTVSASGNSKEEKNTISGAVQATEEELQNSTVVLGSGDYAMTMSYGAYLRYIELGTTGVG